MGDHLVNPDENLSREERDAIDKKLVRKLDLTLIPWLSLLYLASFLDRANIGNAKVDGIETSLRLSTNQFNATLTIFFISYACVEPLSNILLKRVKPSNFLPFIIIQWGICMTFMGLVSNWSGLMAARWFLGLAEAGLYPGVNFYLSCWYKRSELGIRAAIFFSAAAVSGSFGGLLAAAIGKMNGIGGRPAWSWLFILEGIGTIILGVASIWLVQDFPSNATFLSPKDRSRVIYRLKIDNQNSTDHQKFQLRYLWMALKDYKMWLGMAIFAGAAMPLYAFSLFLPSITKDLGYSTTHSQLLSVPPYLVAGLMTMYIGWLADRTSQRGLCNICISVFGIIGFALLLASRSKSVKYAGTFLGALGIFPCIPNTITWISNNVEDGYKRGIVIGFVIGWGNLNGVISSNIYFQGPEYTVGHATAMAFMIVFLLGGSVLLRLLLLKDNQSNFRQGNNMINFVSKSEGIIEETHPQFIYTL